MPRAPLPLGEWGAISTHPHEGARGEWAAQARLHDPVRGRVVQVRRFGATPEQATERLVAALHERAARRPVTMPDFATLGEAVSWWWEAQRPAQGWSEATERSMRYARRNLDEHAAEPWPMTAERAAELLDNGSRTGVLAQRLLTTIRTAGGHA